jgi:hypothetical protein
MGRLNQRQHDLIAHWLPGIVAGLVAWLAFISLGQTSVIRASGLALVIVGMAMTLRRYGLALAITGGLALAFSPAFWSQTGGTDSLSLPLTLLVIVVAGLCALALVRFSDRPYLGLLVGFITFAVLFWSQLASVGSLRLNTLSTAWLLFLLVDGLYLTNPRPDDWPAAPLARHHTVGILALLAVGVVNDPLFTLLVPAVVLGLLLGRARLPLGYWLLLAGFVGLGVYGLYTTYVSSTWWLYPAAQADAAGLRVPYIMADGWREASRWLHLVALVTGQFTVFGVGLGVLGLARLSRWYPPLGTVSMVAYATYALFGLVYFGRNSAVLLLPLLMIQVLWMTYAVHTFRAWLERSIGPANLLVRWLAPAIYVLLPVALLLRITNGL